MHGVYLIHFEKPLHHARHYIGYSSDIAERVYMHRLGKGARLMEVLEELSMKWWVVKVWEGETRAFERRLKNRHGAAPFCPECQREAREYAAAYSEVRMK